jgi:hypothetical protein
MRGWDGSSTSTPARPAATSPGAWTRWRRSATARVVTDQHAAAAVVERLRGRGLSVSVHNLTAPSKTAAFAELRARLYDGSLELYRHERLLAELRRLRTKYTSGQAAVVNPRAGGSHGDIAQALALAVYEQRGGRGDPSRMPRAGGYDRANWMTGERGVRAYSVEDR